MILVGNQTLEASSSAVTTTAPVFRFSALDRQPSDTRRENGPVVSDVHRSFVGTFDGATIITVVPAPDARQTRRITSAFLSNLDSTNSRFTLYATLNGQRFQLFSVILATGEYMTYEEGSGWAVYETNGELKSSGGGGGSGDVVGPVSATDDRIATFDGTTGKLIQDSGVAIGAIAAAQATADAALVKSANLSDVTSAADSRSNIGFATDILRMSQTWLASPGSGLTLSTVAAADAFLGKSNRNIQQADLTPFTQARLTVRPTTAATAGTKLVLKYYTSFSTTVGDYVNVGSSEISVGLDSTSTVTSSWINLAAGAKADVFVSIIQTGGDGATNPVIAFLEAQFRRR